MDTIKTFETIDQDRRRLLGTVAQGSAAASAVSLLSSKSAAAPASDAIRPFRRSTFRKMRWSICAGASTRPVGPIGKRSLTHPKACSSRRSRQLARYWATDTTGARSRRD